MPLIFAIIWGGVESSQKARVIAAVTESFQELLAGEAAGRQVADRPGEVRVGIGLHTHDQFAERRLRSLQAKPSSEHLPKIADFGLAKRVWSERDEGELLVGTPHYMAPELFNGEPATAASDVYALGTCLFVMLTGQVPYQCGSIQALAERVQDESLPDFRKLGIDVPLEIADCIDLEIVGP